MDNSSSVSVIISSGFRQKSLARIVDFARNPSVAGLVGSEGFLARISGEITTTFGGSEQS